MNVKIKAFCLHFFLFAAQFELLDFPRWCSNIGKVWWEILNVCVANFISFLAIIFLIG